MKKKLVLIMLLGILVTLLIVPANLSALLIYLEGSKGTYEGMDACYCGFPSDCICVTVKPRIE